MTEAGDPLREHKQRASAWFAALRDDLCAAFERLERGDQLGKITVLVASERVA